MIPVAYAACNDEDPGIVNVKGDALGRPLLDIALLQAGLETIPQTAHGFVHRGHFPDLIADLAGKSEAPLPDVYHHVSRINQGLWDLFTIAERVVWERRMVHEGHVPALTWAFFVSADVTGFHVTLRALFDHVARVTALCAKRNGTVPGDSFRQLQDWLLKSPGNAKRLGEDLAELVVSAGWFGTLRDVRDSIVHQGGQPFVLPPASGVLFQVVGARVRGVVEPGLMASEDAVDFELYVGKYLGYALGFLDRFAALVRVKYGRPQFTSLAASSIWGISVVHGWVERVLRVAADQAT